MQEVIKSLIGAVGPTIAVIGGVITAFKAIHEIQENRKQRLIEFRWKQVNTAKELLTDVHKHPFASQALMMLDWYNSQHRYELPSGEYHLITWKMVKDAISKEQVSTETEVDVFIRDCFDWFFYFVDRIQYYIKENLIKGDDVLSLFYSYALIINSEESKKVFSEFMKHHEYILANAFFEELKLQATAREKYSPQKS